MLIQFNFNNYLSFKDEVSLDLSATKMTEYNERVVTIGKEKILPVAAIYGANASGKSNVFNAFKCMSNFVIKSFEYGGDQEKFASNKPIPFLFDNDKKNSETSFEVYFTLPNDSSGKIYNYGFCIDQEGVSEEWLHYKAKTAKEYKEIFYRTKDILDLHGLPKKYIDNIKISLNKQVLVISLGAMLKVEICKEIKDWFNANVIADFGDIITNFMRSRRLPKGFINNKDVQQDVIDYLSSFDDSIKGFKVKKISHDNDIDKDMYEIKTLHKMTCSEELVEIPLNLESAGTLKMFSLYPELKEVLNKGSIFFIDELNARLHPLLVRNFILTFLNPKININHAQLIFTTHDTWQLSNQLLRRDEIWFTEKDDKGVSNLYSLADFVDEEGHRIRKDENYEKNYLVGKYGAIPSLKNIDIVKE